MKKINSNLALLVGIAVFAYLVIIGLNTIIESFTRDINLIINDNIFSIYWIVRVVSYVFTVSAFYYLIKWLNNAIRSDQFLIRKAFFTFFIAFFIIQGLQFVYTFYGTNYVVENHLEKFSEYYNQRDQNVNFNYYDIFFDLAKFATLGVIILKKRK